MNGLRPARRFRVGRWRRLDQIGRGEANPMQIRRVQGRNDQILLELEDTEGAACHLTQPYGFRADRVWNFVEKRLPRRRLQGGCGIQGRQAVTGWQSQRCEAGRAALAGIVGAALEGRIMESVEFQGRFEHYRVEWR